MVKNVCHSDRNIKGAIHNDDFLKNYNFKEIKKLHDLLMVKEGVIYYKYKHHVARKRSCITCNRIIVKLPSGEKTHIKNVNYVTFNKFNNGDTVSFNLTDEDIIKNQE